MTEWKLNFGINKGPSSSSSKTMLLFQPRASVVKGNHIYSVLYLFESKKAER